MASDQQNAWVTRVLGFSITDRTAQAKPAAGTPNADALSAELAALIRRIPEAAGADPVIKAQLVKLATDANANLKTRNLNLQQASDFIAQLREVLRDALDAAGVGIGQVTPTQGAPAGSAATTPHHTPVDDDVIAQLRSSYDKLAPALAQAAQATPAIAEGIGMHQVAFRAALAAGDVVTAREHIFELASLAKLGGAAEAAATIPEGTVAAGIKALDEARERWDGALAAAQSGSRSLQNELEVAFPPEAEGFERILDSYWRDLADVINAAKGQGTAGFDGVLQMAESLRTEMMADEVFSFLESNGVPVRPAFITALDDLNSMLRADK